MRPSGHSANLVRTLLDANGSSNVNAVHPGWLDALGIQYTRFEAGDVRATRHNLQVDRTPVVFVGWVNLHFGVVYWDGRKEMLSQYVETTFLVPAQSEVPFSVVLCRDEATELGLRESQRGQRRLIMYE